jgi:prepilin-type N-terminal cleavage/methylation domain-containing protein
MNKQKAFTIVELLTSIAIIAILIGLLLPSLTKIRRSAKEAAQKVQFAAIDTALEAFRQDYGDYPPSGKLEGADSTGINVYCGAQKLTEALLGWDLQGFDPNTAWRRDGLDAFNGGGSYDPPNPINRTRIRPDGQFETLFERKGPYLEVAKTPVFRLGESAVGAKDGLYSYNNSALILFDKTKANWVICDVFGVKRIKDTYGKIVNAGTPILYYKANTNFKMLTCPNNEAQAANSIYNSFDNSPLLALRMLPDETTIHKLSPPPSNFCDINYKIVDQKIPSWVANGVNCYWPNRPDSYILISAEADHKFGTGDDILNF